VYTTYDGTGSGNRLKTADNDRNSFLANVSFFFLDFWCLEAYVWRMFRLFRIFLVLGSFFVEGSSIRSALSSLRV
jgi:hypothetical protein